MSPSAEGKKPAGHEKDVGSMHRVDPSVSVYCEGGQGTQLSSTWVQF